MRISSGSTDLSHSLAEKEIQNHLAGENNTTSTKQSGENICGVASAILETAGWFGRSWIMFSLAMYSMSVWLLSWVVL